MFVLRLLSKLPLRILYVLSGLVYYLVYYVVRYRKEIVLSNLRNSFPHKSQREITDLSKEFYRRFADFAAETLRAVSMPEEEIRQRVTFVNSKILQPYADRDQSIVITATHSFNWEWALLSGCLQLPYPVDAIYAPLSSAKMDALMFNLRSRFGGYPIKKQDALMEIMRRAKRKKAVAINADQVPAGKAEIYWTKFLNQDTAFFVGAEQIPKLLKYPTFFMKVKRVRRGYYSIELVKIGEPPYEKEGHNLLDNYIIESEKIILEDPANWLWSHRRWKRKKPLYS